MIFRIYFTNYLRKLGVVVADDMKALNGHVDFKKNVKVNHDIELCNPFSWIENPFSRIAIRSLELDSPFSRIAIRFLDFNNLLSRIVIRSRDSDIRQFERTNCNSRERGV